MAESLGWQWKFGVQVPFVVLCIGVTIKVVPDSLGLQRSSCKGIRSAMAEFDGRGSFLLAAATTALILGLVGLYYKYKPIKCNCLTKLAEPRWQHAPM